MSTDAFKAVVPRYGRRGLSRLRQRVLAPPITGRVAFGDLRRPIGRDFGLVVDWDSTTFERSFREAFGW